MTPVSELSDAQLRSLLSQHGFQAGPITATTRRVYELKLESLLKGGRGGGGARAASESADSARKRRQTLDTLRTTERPKFESRRSENSIASRSNVPASLNLSDYSDTELSELSVTASEHHLDTPVPPRKLVIATANRAAPVRRKQVKTIDPSPPANSSLFSDTEDDDKTKKRGSSKVGYTNNTLIIVSVFIGLCASVVAGYVGYQMYKNRYSAPIIARQCQNLTLDITMIECDRIFTELVRQKRELDVFSGEVECGDKEGDLHIPAPYSLSERQLIFYLREELNYTIFVRREDQFIELESQAELEDFDPVNTVFFYSTQTPQITWYCYVTTICSNFAYYFFTAAVTLVVVQIAHKAWQWKNAKARQETGQMYELIDQIIEELQRNYTKYLSDPINHVPYVAIPHARDRLLLPSQRATMKPIWDKAVQFIAQHESRVRVEMRRVQSEDFPVWYWLEASKSDNIQPQPDSTSSPDFLYPDLDSDLASLSHSGSKLN